MSFFSILRLIYIQSSKRKEGVHMETAATTLIHCFHLRTMLDTFSARVCNSFTAIWLHSTENAWSTSAHASNHPFVIRSAWIKVCRDSWRSYHLPLMEEQRRRAGGAGLEEKWGCSFIVMQVNEKKDERQRWLRVVWLWSRWGWCLHTIFSMFVYPSDTVLVRLRVMSVVTMISLCDNNMHNKIYCQLWNINSFSEVWRTKENKCIIKCSTSQAD